jgi:large subunit ribosomal protein L23
MQMPVKEERKIMAGKTEKTVKTGKAAKSKKAAAQQSKAARKDYQLLLRPLVTEKSSVANAAEGRSCVVFEVDPCATKTDIRGAVERVFGVSVEAVRTCNNPGKLKARGRSIGRTSDTRKAYVTLAPGQTINVVDGL